jgi:hypothetical protein
MAMRVHVKVPSDRLKTTGDLLRRMQETFDLMRSGQDGLSFLRGQEALNEATILIIGQELVLLPVIPRASQGDMFGSGRRVRRNAPAALARRDESEQQAINEAVALLHRSADIVQRVGAEMASSTNLRERFRALERDQGVDTGPARTFHYRKQAEFFVDVDGERISFQHMPVRNSVATTGSVAVQATLVPGRTRITDFRARVDACSQTGRNEGIASGGEHTFRMHDPKWWQRAALEIGAHLGLSVDMAVIERMSTCSLQAQPAEVEDFRYWLSFAKVASVAFADEVAELERAAHAELTVQRDQPAENGPMVDAA